MDIEVRQVKPCSCGRGIITMTGFCAACMKESADAFWAFVNGEITEAGFYRRLRRRVTKGNAAREEHGQG
jgi:hypothetical protein